MCSGYAFVRARVRCPLAVLTLLLVLLPSPFAFAARKQIEIRSIRIVAFDGNKTVFVVLATERPKFDIFTLKNPERLVIDCRQAVLASPISDALSEANPAVARIRTAQFDKDLVRIVLDLKQPVEYRASVDGNRLIIQVGRDSKLQAPSYKTDLEMSVESKPASPTVPHKDKKNAASKPRWKMKGYATDRFKKSPATSGNIPSMVNAYALSFRIRKGDEDSSIRMNYAVSGYDAFEPGIVDYRSHDFKVGYRWRFASDWRVKTVGQAGFNQVAEKYGFVPELQYRFNHGSSFRFYGGHVTKMFTWQDRTDQNRFFGLAYETRLGAQTLELGYRYNVNDSEIGYYDYINSKYTVGYRVPWSEKGRTLFQLEYSPRQYMSRFVSADLESDPEFRALRQEEGLTFSAVSRIPLSRNFEIVPRYSFKVKSFNDPWTEDYSRHLSSFALRGRW